MIQKLLTHKHQYFKMEFTTTTHFKTNTTEEEMDSLIEKCNNILAEDYGDSVKFNLTPDLIVAARSTKNGDIVGFLSLNFTPKTNAWELCTLSAIMPYRHKKLLTKFMEHIPKDIISEGHREGHKAGSKSAWLVKRVKSSETRTISDLEALGFSKPEDWLVGILSEEGYIPFDPVDEFLMKKKII